MSLDVDPRQERKLKALAQESGKPVGEILRELLDEALLRRKENGAHEPSGEGESFLDAARRVGAVGCVKGGPTDVATNPKHLESFGES
jgi:hypothetical protein